MFTIRKTILTAYNHKIFLLVFLFCISIRLWHINNPLLDEHSWRQTASAMVARNYVETPNFFKPQTDFEYRYPGAFGLYEYVVGILGKIFGYSDILGRLVSLVIFLIGFVYFYRLVYRFWGHSIALWASAFYSFFPVSVFYSRSFQTDSGMVSLGIIFLYYFTLWVNRKKIKYLIISAFLANLTFLFKLPSVYLLIAATGYWFIKERWQFVKDRRWYIFVVFSLILPLFYQLYVPIATNGRIYSAIFEQDKFGSIPVYLSFEFWFKTFLPWGNLFEYHYMHAGYILLLLGIFKKVQKIEQWFFYVWMFSVFMFFIVAAKGMHHEYYSLPLMPVACVFIGRFLGDFYAGISKRWSVGRIEKFKIGLVSFMVLYSFVFSMIRLHDRLKINPRYLEIAEVVNKNTKPQNLVVVLDKSEPEILYYSHRKGMHIRSTGDLEKYLLGKDNKYSAFAVTDFIVDQIDKSLYGKLKSKYEIIVENQSGIVGIKNPRGKHE